MLVRSFIVIASMLVTSAAFAQANAPKTGTAKQTPAPAASAPAPSAQVAPPKPDAGAPIVVPPQTSAAILTSISPGQGAPTAEAARAYAAAKMQQRQTACAAKGGKFVPPHIAGDARPNGGFYVGTSAGGCRPTFTKAGLAQ